MGAVQVRLASDGFLSTPSARRATVALCNRNIGILISIHALREEGDYRTLHDSCFTDLFLSTPSARRATTSSTTYTITQLISIHALREEGDPSSQGPLLCL